MVDRRDVEMVVHACAGLQLEPRQQRWAHLSLCVLDAVFSINARYEATVRVCRRYAATAGLEPVLVAPQEIPITGEQPLPKFLEDVAAHDSERFAGEVHASRQRTSTRSGVLKAEAAGRYAQVLVAAGVHRLGDVAPLLADPARLAPVEQDLKAVPGHGRGARLSYLWMLAGDDEHVKPDRMVLNWLSRVLERPVPKLSQQQATDLLVAAAAAHGCTPWELDQAVWRAQRRRSPG